MSLKLLNKKIKKLCNHCLALLLTTFCCIGVLATELNNKLQVHGFVAQGIIDVNGSDFVNDDEDLSFELTDIGINASYQFSPDIRIAGQAVYLNGGNRYSEGFRVDYLLLDWAAYHSEDWQTNIYLGRFKNYHWLYSSTRDVPMTRPSIVLPQSVYFDGTRDLSVGGDGVAITSRYSSDTIGEIDFNISSGISPISSQQTDIIMGRFSNGDLSHDTDLQASIYWQPNFSQWRFGLALTDADFSYDSGKNDNFIDGKLQLQRLYANTDFQAENWTFSAELLQEHMIIDDLLYPGFQRDIVGQGGFVQGQYRLNSDLSVFARGEHFYADKDDKTGTKLEEVTFGMIPKYFGYQHEITIGAHYNILSNLQLQVEQHWVKGTARLTPVVIPDPTVNKREYWQMWAAQLIYWF